MNSVTFNKTLIMIRTLLCFFTIIFFTSLLQAQPFQHTSSQNNIESGWTYLDNPQLNNNPRAVIHIELISGPSKGKNLGVWYASGKNKWAIFHQDRTPLQAGNVFMVNPAGDFTHRAAKAN